MNLNYQFFKDNNLLLFEAITGSQAYGTSTPQSDVDRKYIFVLPQDSILGIKYVPQVDDSKDFGGFEVKRFLELLSSNNPTVLDLIGNYPPECVLFKHPAYNLILEQRDKFITKRCKDSFAGYARQQINKAEGMNKMQNWEVARVKRKVPLDFCYIIEGARTYSLNRFLEVQGWKQQNCGLSSISHARDMYALFYDETGQIGYKGIQRENSHKIILSSIPKGEEPISILYYNEDGYSEHAKDWRQYQTWLKERNVSRWTDVKAHGQAIDGKNLLHCTRLIEMATEIAEGKGINVRRSNTSELLKIRKGEVPLKKILDDANIQIDKLNGLFDNSNLPDEVDKEMVHELLVKIRKIFYNDL